MDGECSLNAELRRTSGPTLRIASVFERAFLTSLQFRTERDRA